MVFVRLMFLGLKLEVVIVLIFFFKVGEYLIYKFGRYEVVFYVVEMNFKFEEF